MEWKVYFGSVIKGVIWSLLITFLITIIFSLAMNIISLSQEFFNIIYVIISCVSLVFGSIMAVKSYGKKGWIIGFSVGCVFYIALYFIGVIFGADKALGFYDLLKFGLCILIGTLSGMLGINL